MDSLTKPERYNQGEIDVIEALYKTMPLEAFRGFMKGNIIKYTIRYNLKGGIEDLEKAKVYLNRLIDVENIEAVKAVEPVDADELEGWFSRD